MTEENTKTGTIIRPPVVVILGHVDHGKTSILDFIRKSKVAEGEAGGITQHIGAYQVEIPQESKSRASEVSRGIENEIPHYVRDDHASNSRTITFLDTPGHEAFSAIRSRGAKVADVGILVIAADEGIKPQTKEAIKILQDSEIPFVVALNKIDKEGANSQKVKQELSENNILPEEWGGKVPLVEVSAKTGQGIDSLLEMILLLAELEELSADPHSPASGIVVESHMDNKRGNMATLLVLDGTLKLSDWIVAGKSICRVKSMEDFRGKSVKEIIPSEPAVVLGWESVPRLGNKFQVTQTKEEAEKKAIENSDLGKTELFVLDVGAVETNKKILNLIVKADVFSSLEAIDQVLKTIKSEEVGYRLISYGVGNIGDGDVKKAISSGALVIGFHAGMDRAVPDLAEREKIEILNFDIIYELVAKVREKMEAMLEPETRKTILGKMKVLAIFKKEDKTQIIGGKVISGQVKRGATLDVLRNGGVLLTGRIGQLQHNKGDVEEVKEGLECGIRFDLPKKEEGVMLPIREGDLLEIYEEEKIKRYLE